MGIFRSMDRAMASLMGFRKMFSGGWGNFGLLRRLLERTRSFGPPRPIDVKWIRGKRRLDGLYWFYGYFDSPDQRLPLPPASRTAYFEYILPSDAFEAPGFPCVTLQLAGTGDDNYFPRRKMAKVLAERYSIGSVILQNPFYGERRPSDQWGTALRHVTDQFLMNIATIEEARSLLVWLLDEGAPVVGVTGYSMGGYMSALTAQELDFPVVTVPMVTGISAEYPIVWSPLQKIIDWDRLKAQLPADRSARRLFADIMRRFEIADHGEVPDSRWVTLVGAEYDQFVPPLSVRKLSRQWPDSEIAWLDSGHVSGWITQVSTMADIIGATFARVGELLEESSRTDELNRSESGPE